MPVRTALEPGVLSPTLPVPKSIPRPEYAWQPTVREGSEPAFARALKKAATAIARNLRE